MNYATDLRSVQALHDHHRDRLVASAGRRGRPLGQRIVAVRVALAGWIAPHGVRPVRIRAARTAMDGTLHA
jgi:hypothetical protein